MTDQERIARARAARFELTEVVLEILMEAEEPLWPEQIGKRAGLSIFNSGATVKSRWAIIDGALDQLMAENKVKRDKDEGGYFVFEVA